jgi:hypothetical protein
MGIAAFIVKTEVRSQKKSGSCLFSWTGVTTASVMTIYRENAPLPA